MDRRVAIVGIGQTRYETGKTESLDEIAFEAASKALADAGITRDEVDNVVIAASDQLDGRPISSMTLACPAGGYLKDEVKASDDGTLAVVLACLRLLSGVFHTSLVVSWCKCSEVPTAKVTNLSFDPFFHRDLGLNHINALSFQVNSYLSRYPISEWVPAKIVVKNRANAMGNPYAHLVEEVSLEEVVQSPIVCPPLRQLHLPLECDGACALVLTTRERVRLTTQKPVWISGLGWAMDSYYLGERDLHQLSSVAKAARQAYQRAGIKKPIDEIDVAEINELSAYHEIMAYEALDFCTPGEGYKLVEEGSTELTGKIPVNPSGGALAASPLFAAGLVRIAEAALQVRGDAGERQVTGVRTALAASCYGICAQGSSVFILSQES
ncbi:MAG TPA: thiolase family protein [Dehalococcoidia bacterium]|nr:thiolase family protein [Dehalococcoidia bacterium]